MVDAPWGTTLSYSSLVPVSTTEYQPAYPFSSHGPIARDGDWSPIHLNLRLELVEDESYMSMLELYQSWLSLLSAVSEFVPGRHECCILIAKHLDDAKFNMLSSECSFPLLHYGALMV